LAEGVRERGLCRVLARVIKGVLWQLIKVVFIGVNDGVLGYL
jgi:hypothetical protein